MIGTKRNVNSAYSTPRACTYAEDPNRLDDEQYILRLIAQVITVSLETRKVVKELPVIHHP